MINEAVGEDENREGLETPTRIAKMYQEILQDQQTAEEHLSKSFEIIDNNIWSRRISSSIPCVSITFTILWKCTLPIPNGRVAGLSKLSGLQPVEVYAKTTDSGTLDGRNRNADALMEYLGDKEHLSG